MCAYMYTQTYIHTRFLLKFDRSGQPQRVTHDAFSQFDDRKLRSSYLGAQGTLKKEEVKNNGLLRAPPSKLGNLLTYNLSRRVNPDIYRNRNRYIMYVNK